MLEALKGYSADLKQCMLMFKMFVYHTNKSSMTQRLDSLSLSLSLSLSVSKAAKTPFPKGAEIRF